MEVIASMGSTRIGKYRLIRELGRGGMGVVYLAEDTRLQRQVALKVLHPFLSMDVDFVARFTSEARAIAALAHKGIVRIHAFEEVEGSHLIDMEYIEGGSLEFHLREGRLTPMQGLGIALRVFEALAACHAQGIIHRDVKPSNILMATDGRVLLTDFGLARSCAFASTASASASCFIGTPKYAAPESWGKSGATPAGDVYSAGLVLLELLCGRTPFDGDSPLEIMRKMLAAPRINIRGLLPDASDELTATLYAMLDADPARRPADADEALQCLRAIPEFAHLPDERSETIRVTPAHLRGSNSTRQGRWLAGVATGIVLALVAVFAIAWRPPKQPGAAAPSPIPVASIVAETPALATSPLAPPNPAYLAATGKFLVFVANSGDWRSLWSYDTTTGKTAPLWPTLSMDPGDDLYGAYPVTGAMVAVIRSDTNGLTLFRTDGTPEGTAPLAFAASREANRIDLLGAQGGKAWFNRIGGDGTLGLWETDGTLAGTRHVWGDHLYPMFDALQYTQGGALYFRSDAANTLHALSAGAAEAVLLNEATALKINAGNFITLDEKVFAQVEDGPSGGELYLGTTEPGSLRLFRDFIPGPVSGLQNARFARYKNGVVFAASTPEMGEEPWFSDGTAEGTRLLTDVNPGAGASAPFRFTESGSLLFFSGQNAQSGRELWVFDGDTDSARMLADLGEGVESGDPYAFLPFNGGLLFTPHETVHGEELWFSDGTPEGTRLVHEFVPGPEGGEPHNPLMLDDKIYFTATHPEKGRLLWEFDGTPESIRPVFENLQGERAATPSPAELLEWSGRVYSALANDGHGNELWSTDSATGEATLVRDIYPGPEGSFPRHLIALDSYLYFSADDGIHGIELWRTDGTATGTTLVHDAFLGKNDGAPRDLLAPGAGHLIFLADTGPNTLMHSLRLDKSGVEVVPPPPAYKGAWRPFDLRLGHLGHYELSVMTPSGETTLWRLDFDGLKRLPGTSTSTP